MWGARKLGTRKSPRNPFGTLRVLLPRQMDTVVCSQCKAAAGVGQGGRMLSEVSVVPKANSESRSKSHGEMKQETNARTSSGNRNKGVNNCAG